MELIILLVVLYLLFGKKKPKKSSTRKKASKKNSFGEHKDRLTRNGEPPWGWYTENREFIARVEAEHNYFYNAYDKSRRKGIKQEYAALKCLILHMQNVQICYAIPEQYLRDGVVVANRILELFQE